MIESDKGESLKAWVAFCFVGYLLCLGSEGSYGQRRDEVRSELERYLHNLTSLKNTVSPIFAHFSGMCKTIVQTKIRYHLRGVAEMSQKIVDLPTQPAFVIRPVERHELEKLIEIYRSGYEGLEEYAETDEKDIRDYLEWLYEGEPNGFLVAETESELIGFISVHTDWWDRRYQRRTAEFHELVVKRDWQSKGIGKALMMAGLDYARAKGCEYASLWVGEGNLKARKWYHRLGFEEVGKSWGVWVRMVKKLINDV